MSPVLDLAAVPGALAGEINLSWTEPTFNGAVNPRFYDIRVSTTGQISSGAEFDAAQALSVFSPSVIPAPGLGGGLAAMTVSGLQAGVVHFFAIREYDSTLPTPLTGAWNRSVPSGWNVNNYAASTGSGVPAPVADLTASTGPAEGDVRLTWTAPASSTYSALGSYDVRYATFSVPSLGGDAATWFAAAPYQVAFPTATTTGAAQSLLIHGLWPACTFYFAVRSADLSGHASPVDVRAVNGPQAQSMPRNFPPAMPQGLAVSAGLNRAVLSWTALTPAERGLDFAFYRVQRSTEAGAGFVTVATTTAVSLTDRFLAPFTSYYYRLSARDQAGLESAFTSTVSVLPFNITPEEPQGIRSVLSADGSSTTFSWAPVRTFDDGTPFDSTGTPTQHELQGYRLLRSTSACNPYFSFLSSAAVSASSFTAFTDGDLQYFKIHAYNTAGVSTETFVVSSRGEQHFYLPDCATRLVITDQMAAALDGAANGLGYSIDIERRYRPEDVVNDIFQAVEFKARRDGVGDIPAFHFDQPATVVLHYSTGAGGGVAPAGLSLAEARPAAVAPENLGIFWYNGAEFKKLYGRVNTAAQTVSVDTPNIGIFQIRALLRSNGAVFDLSNLSGRVFTPNGDHKNDLMVFGYDPGPRSIVPTGKIYDLKGMYVADMTAGLVPYTLVWDGRMNGKVVAGGVYVYEIKGDGKTFSGTIVVAK